jgi:hypothetical protein
MNVIITENQYVRLVENYWDREKLYDRKKIVERLKKGPSYIKQYIKKLPHIEMQDDQGNIQIATKIPQTIYQYLFGNF